VANHNRKYYLFAIQLVISLLALVFVVFKVLQFQDWAFFFEWLLINRWSFLLLLIAQVVLSGLNLSLEALKWKLLISVLKPQKFVQAFIQVIRGIQLGMLTPARTGEPVGKAMLFEKGSRTQALLLSAAGSMMQNLVIILVGLVSTLALNQYGLLDHSVLLSIQKGILNYGLLIPIIGLLVIYGIYRFVKFVFAAPITKRISFQIYKKLGSALIFKAFGITFLRFLVFSFQLWLVLDFFKVVSLPEHFWLIPLYFITITFVPTIALADLGIRGSIAFFVFGVASSNTAAIMSGIFIIWLFNLAIPSILGIFLLKRKK
jgi:hypothetical protein